MSATADEEDILVEDLRGLVWSDQRTNHRSWQKLAADAGLCYSTVRNFAAGETKRPQVPTLERLLRAMDYRFAVVPASLPRLRQEIDLSLYRRKK